MVPKEASESKDWEVWGAGWKTGCKGSVLTGYITGAPSMVLAPRSSFQGKSNGSFRTGLEGEFQTLLLAEESGQQTPPLFHLSGIISSSSSKKCQDG